MKQIPVYEFIFPEPGPEHFHLTCRNHPTAEYSTKNPYQRHLHLLKFPDGMNTECDCPFDDLVVLVKEDERPTSFELKAMEGGGIE